MDTRAKERAEQSRKTPIRDKGTKISVEGDGIREGLRGKQAAATGTLIKRVGRLVGPFKPDAQPRSCSPA